MLLSDYKDCYAREYPDPHAVTEKYWIIVFLQISFVNLMREKVTQRIDKAYQEGKLTYR